MNNELLANKTFNTETSRTGMLVPAQLRTDANAMISFLEEYYRLSNATGNPTNLINDFVREHDIDSITEPFFAGIQNLIAKNIPNSKFDRQTLYKRIIDYYSIRGSENSVKAFFKIFHNKEAVLYYPKNDLLKPSDGKYTEVWPNWISGKIKYISQPVIPSNWNYSQMIEFAINELPADAVDWNYSGYNIHDLGIFLNSDGYISDTRLKVQDSYYWQDFSYEIQTDISDNIWKNDYLKLVHPAGLMFFQRIVATIVSVNSWIEYDYATAELDEIITKILPPPRGGDHSPVQQYASNYQIIPTNIVIRFPNLIALPNNVTLGSIIKIDIVSSVMTSINPNYYSASQLNMNTTDHMNYLKFLDESKIAGYGINYQPIDFVRSYSLNDGSLNNYQFPPAAIGSIVLAALSVTSAAGSTSTTLNIVGITLTMAIPAGTLISGSGLASETVTNTALAVTGVQITSIALSKPISGTIVAGGTYKLTYTP